jgi:hypothetical protein
VTLTPNSALLTDACPSALRASFGQVKRERWASLMQVKAVLVLSLIMASPALAWKPVANRGYVTAGPDGVLYARSIPSQASGDAGVTEIFQVKTEGDQKLDRYEWYNAAGLILAWSPIAGKVGIMRLKQDTGKEPNEQIEFSFYIGGKHLRSYTTADLLRFGADLIADYPRGTKRAGYTVVGAEQIPRSNDYVYSILIKDKKVQFDVLTGKPWGSAPSTNGNRRME